MGPKIPWSHAIVGRLMKCRNLTSHANLEQHGGALLLAIFVHLFMHSMESTTNKNMTPSNDLCTFWVPQESNSFVKQVVQHKVYVKLKMELSAITICFDGKSKDIFPYISCID